MIPDSLSALVEYGRSVNVDASRPVFPRDYNTGLATLLGQAPFVGSFTYSMPVVPEDERVGYYLASYFDDWYYRMHFIPLSIDLGNLAGDQQRTLRVWNAYLVPVDVTSEELINGTGISYTSDFPLPGTLPALQQVTYQLSIDAEGPAVVDAQMTWTIDGVDYSVPITGRRAVFFGLAPNWQTPFRESFEWRTIVDTSYSGLEQRTGTRRNPRVSHEYQIRAFREQAKAFDLLTFGWQARLFAVPMWHEKMNLAIAASIGDDSITVNEASYRTLFPLQSVVFWVDESDYELAQIDSVAGNVITFSGPIARDWPANTRVYPCVISKISQDMSTTRQLPTHVDALVRLSVSPSDNKPRLPVVAAPMTYRGEELYADETNWREAMPIRIAASETVTDLGTGPFRVYRRADFPTIDRGFLWMAKNRQASENLRAFFVRRQGRLTPVWMPSGTQDFVLAAPALSTSSFIYVQPTAYPELINENPARRDLIIKMRDGTVIARRISDVVHDTPERDVVNLDAALGQDLSIENVKMISFLGLYRLTSDTITFIWYNDAVVEVNSSFTLTEPTE